jgi:glycerol-3-phosphate dehydrogenase
MIAPSQGIHIVLDKAFLGGDTAIMVPRTSDGRVMFAIPWHGHTVVGTTDTPIPTASLEPAPLQQEIDFILETASRYLARPPTRADIKSVFTGIRPLVKAGATDPTTAGATAPGSTAALSRDHTISISASGLLTIAGGKWTTYRRMAQDAVDHAATLGRLDDRPCPTHSLQIHGFHRHPEQFGALGVYGSDAASIQFLMKSDEKLGKRLHPALPIHAAQVVWAARHEMARTLDDVLSRRTRALPLNAKAAVEMAPEVVKILAKELNKDDAWQQEQLRQFTEIARHYLIEVS